MLSIPRT